MEKLHETIKASQNMSKNALIVKFRELVAEIQETDVTISYEKACQIVKSNLAYTAGYYSNETRLQIEKDFNCIHPILGSAKIQHDPIEIFKLGQAVMQMKLLGRKDADIHQQPKGDPF